MQPLCVFDAATMRCLNCGRMGRGQRACLPAELARIFLHKRPPPTNGPAASTHPRRCLAGTHLKHLLARLGISADEPGCQCNSRAAQMDRQGCEWVAANVDTVVGWLREEAQKRGLPFIDAAGKMLVREALRRARKDAAARAKRPPRHD